MMKNPHRYRNQNPNPNYIPPMSASVRDNAPDNLTVIFYEEGVSDWIFCTTVNRVIPNKDDCVIIENKMYTVEQKIIDYENGQIYVFVKYLKEVKRYNDNEK